VVFEILDRALVSFGCFSRREGSEIASASGLGIFLARVQAVLAGLEFSDHVLGASISFSLFAHI